MLQKYSAPALNLKSVLLSKESLCSDIGLSLQIKWYWKLLTGVGSCWRANPLNIAHKSYTGDFIGRKPFPESSREKNQSYIFVFLILEGCPLSTVYTPCAPNQPSHYPTIGWKWSQISFIWAPVNSCTHWLRLLYSPPHLGSYTGALLVSENRRHLFVTPCPEHTPCPFNRPSADYSLAQSFSMQTLSKSYE